MTIQDAKTVSDEIENEKNKIIIKKMPKLNYLQHVLQLEC